MAPIFNRSIDGEPEIVGPAADRQRDQPSLHPRTGSASVHSHGSGNADRLARRSAGPPIPTQSLQLNDAELLSRARHRRAVVLQSAAKMLLFQLLRASAPRRITFSVIIAAGLVLAYAMLLSHAGMHASIPVLFAILLASTLSSIAGFAFSAICGAMLLRLMGDPVQIVEVMMVCSIAIQSFSVAMLRRDIEWRNVITFLIGGLGGLPIGVMLLLHLGNAGFKEAIGGLLIVYASYALLQHPITIRGGGRFADACVGFLGGISGGLAGFPGASVTIWCGMRGWEKRRQRSIYQPYILIMQIAALVLLQFMSPPLARGGSTLVEAVQFVPVALLGTWFGLKIFRRLSDWLFTLTINTLLLASGIGLLT